MTVGGKRNEPSTRTKSTLTLIIVRRKRNRRHRYVGNTLYADIKIINIKKHNINKKGEIKWQLKQHKQTNTILSKLFAKNWVL